MIRWEQQCLWATRRPAWIILEPVSPHYRELKPMSLWPRAKSWFFSRSKWEEKSAGRNFKQDWRPRWAMQCHTPSTIKRYKQTPPARYRRFTEIMQTFISLPVSATSRQLPALEGRGWVGNSDNGLVHAWSVQTRSLGSHHGWGHAPTQERTRTSQLQPTSHSSSAWQNPRLKMATAEPLWNKPQVF